jgi:hypothetical protein
MMRFEMTKHEFRITDKREASHNKAGDAVIRRTLSICHSDFLRPSSLII